ncbi:shikimate kinase [Rothia sp. P7208]|uniref:shikimate kinase n=1 Tax=Rothia sp. P7208 TaxID=3402660 RepID=UPI003ACA34EC
MSSQHLPRERVSISSPDPQHVREVQEEFLDRRRPVVFIGPMAAGKSYIGMHCARFYGYQFLDADQLITEQYGSIPEIFDTLGEEYFRKVESETIFQVLESPQYRNSIFSLGGGAPMSDQVAQKLKNECVIYLKVDADTVRPRILGNKTRPLLQGDPIQRWNEIFQLRKERYEQLANYTLDVRGSRPVSEIAAEVQQFILCTRGGVTA